MPPRVLLTYLRARGLSQRTSAMAALVVGGLALGRLPTPALRADLEPAAYPAVLVGALVPVLVGVVAAVPVRARLTWLTAMPSGRARLLDVVDRLLVLACAAVAGGLSASTAGLTWAGVQNALVVAAVAAASTVVVRLGPACVLVGGAAVVSLLTAPDTGIVDRAADLADWMLLAVLVPLGLALPRRH